MPSQQRYAYTQNKTIGSGQNAWQYAVTIFQVENPFPRGTGNTLVSTTTIPNDIFIEIGNAKSSFDLGKISDGDKIENVSVKMLDDASGTWLEGNIFTPTIFTSDWAFQLQIQCDLGSGTLRTVFFGEIDPRTIVFEPEYMDVVSGLRKQMVTFTATDIFISALQAMPFGDSTAFFVNSASGGGTTISGFGNTGVIPTQNSFLPPTPGEPSTGVMTGFTNYRTLPSNGTGNWNNVHPPNIFTSGGTNWAPMYLDDQKFANYVDVITQLTIAVANRMGWTAGTPSVDFSHIQFSYNGTTSAVGTVVPSNVIAPLLALQRTAFLSSYTWIQESSQTNPNAFPMPDYSPAKQGTAWDGFQLLLEAFLQYAYLTYNDSNNTVTINITSPLSTTLSWLDPVHTTAEPKVAKLKYTPYAFAARSVSGAIINADSRIVSSATNAVPGVTNQPLFPTNNLSYSAPFTNANQDISTRLALGTYDPPADDSGNAQFENQVAVFGFKPINTLPTTTVFTGASNTQQILATNTGISPGDTLYFMTSNVYGTVQSIGMFGLVTLTQSITTATGETVIDIDFNNIYCVDNNANGAMASGGALIGPVQINLGFGGALGTIGGSPGAYGALTLTDAVTRALFSMFCGFTLDFNNSYTVTSRGMEVAEFDILVDPHSPTTTAGVFMDTTNINKALLKQVLLTTDTQHTFIIIGVDVQYFGAVRTAHVTAVRQLA